MDIPIIVTRKGKPTDPLFKFASPQLLEQLREKRNPTIPKPRNTNLEPRHQTLDAEGAVTASRSRRISSSAAARRFPKDFFKDENCLHPIKSIRGKHKQCEPIEPCFLDTFSQKQFLAAEAPRREEEGTDTPKFKQRADKVDNNKAQNSRNGRLRSKIQQLIQETPPAKYHTADPNTKHPLLQIFEPQRQEAQPFAAVPAISNFNVTLGQKVALSFLMKGQKSKRKKEEKQNNEGGCVQGSVKADGFRIRRKLQP